MQLMHSSFLSLLDSISHYYTKPATFALLLLLRWLLVVHLLLWRILRLLLSTRIAPSGLRIAVLRSVAHRIGSLIVWLAIVLVLRLMMLLVVMSRRICLVSLQIDVHSTLVLFGPILKT